MGFFSSSKKVQLPWTHIESVDQLESILHNVGSKPVLLFKHSTRCSISIMALNSFESKWGMSNDECEIYFIDLLKNRDVSNSIETLTGVIHQSPQVIVVKGREVIYDATHSSIDAKRIESIIKK